MNKITSAERMRIWRRNNPEKVRAQSKKDRAKPAFKEYRRKWMRDWRKKNKERSDEIARKSWGKNKAKYNNTRRIRYKTDEGYRSKKIASDKQYAETGKRSKAMAKHAPKLRAKSAQWKRENPDKVKKYVRQYKDNIWIPHEREQRKNLDDRYVIKVVKKSMNYVVKTLDIPKELIEIERIKIFTKRKLKQTI